MENAEIKVLKEIQQFKYETPIGYSENVKQCEDIIKDKLNNRDILTAFQMVTSMERLELEAPNDPKIWIKKGLELERQMLYYDAVQAYSQGLEHNTFNDVLYECRGHIYVTLGRYYEAITDSTMCIRLNPLNWYGWYHKGLGHYFLGRYEEAVKAFKGCLDNSYEINVHRLAAIDWMYVSLMHLGKVSDARELLININESTLEDTGALYKTRLLIYKGIKTPEEIIPDIPDNEDSDFKYSILGYAVAMKYYFDGNKKRAKQQLISVVNRDNGWQTFGYLASRKELERLFNVKNV